MIYLVSTSPRRKKLLRMAGVRFKTLRPDYEEKKVRGLSPRRLVRLHALGKALSAASSVKNGCILSADTLVFFGGRIIGKPRNIRDAFRILSSLQGKWHEVYTGVALVRVSGAKAGKVKVLTEKTQVKISAMTPKEIKAYFRKINPLDKAGAYAIQSKHSIVESVRGLRSNAIGLPIERILSDLSS